MYVLVIVLNEINVCLFLNNKCNYLLYEQYCNK